MRLWAVVLLMLLTQQPSSEKASIEGIVVSSTTNTPIHGAPVMLMRRATPPGQTAPDAVTDMNGRFALKGLDAGTYRLTIAADGFARQDTGTPIILAAGQVLKDVIVSLTPTGTVSGRVTGPMDEPLVGIEVLALQSTYGSDGARSFRPVATAQTNDRGEYRLFWITPGRYYFTVGSAQRPGNNRPTPPSNS